jgi:hypothetical protein
LKTRKKAQALYEERRSRLLEENKQKQEQLLRKEQEKWERKLTKKMLEERWAISRLITGYIDVNTDRWKQEQKVRKENQKQTAEEWKKMERFDKIRTIKEKLEENTAVKISLRPAKLQLMPRKSELNTNPAEK